MTKKLQAQLIKKKLGENPSWAVRAMVRSYERQTADEQATAQTTEHNGIGFSGVDAEILTSFTQQWAARGWLSEKQWQILLRRMPRYWRQIIEIANPKRLESALGSSFEPNCHPIQ